MEGYQHPFRMSEFSGQCAIRYVARRLYILLRLAAQPRPLFLRRHTSIEPHLGSLEVSPKTLFAFVGI